MINRITCISMFLFVALISGCAAGESTKQGFPKGLTPIDLRIANSVATINFSLSAVDIRNNPNPVMLALQVLLPATRSDLMNKYQNTILDVTGNRFGVLTENEITRPAPHHPIRLYVTWVDLNNNRVVKSGDVVTQSGWQGRVAVAAGPSLTLDSMRLPAGRYQITVKTLNNDDRFDSGFWVGLCVGTIWE